MTFSMPRTALAIMAALALAAPGTRADAAFVTYTQSVTASGYFFNTGTSFTNALLTFTETADTNNVTALRTRDGSIPGFGVTPATTTLAISGLGPISIVTPGVGFVVAVLSNGQAGIGVGSAANGFSNLLGGAYTPLTSYDLRTSVGPLDGATSNGLSGISTNLGNLIITSVGSTTTFQASVVPEPSSLALGSIAALTGLGVARARRRRAD